MKKLLNVVFWIWELPQNLIGFLMRVFLGSMITSSLKYKNAKVFYMSMPHGAVSLGRYIFMFGDYWKGDQATIQHEYGHTIQSRILGPLYLLVIGLPSIIWAGLFDDWRRKHNKSYYWFYPEAWANKLGGLDKDGNIID